jgi:uroporphyrinogen decarboxylase
MSHRENYIRAAAFQYPQWIPCWMAFPPALVRRHGTDLEALVRDHPRLFPDYDPRTWDRSDLMPAAYRGGERYTDNWGCTWRTEADGMEGQVVGHPLADWGALEGWRPPDPLTMSERAGRDWARERAAAEERRAAGRLTVGHAERLFDRLFFLRGFEALMIDFAEEPPELDRLIGMLGEHEHRVVDEWLRIGVDVVAFHSDLGTQRGLMISPASFRRRLLPLFASLFGKIRAAGSLVALSSDGRILDIIEDLAACGLSLHDPQLGANTIEDIARVYKGRLCVSLDLNSQSFPFLAPGQLRDVVKSSVETLGDPRGGLMLLAEPCADTPLCCLEALCGAFEDFCLEGMP